VTVIWEVVMMVPFLRYASALVSEAAPSGGAPI
jgi:hypothetical protein